MVDHVPQPSGSGMMATMTIPQPEMPASEPAGPDFVVVDVETACSSVSSICQIGIVGFRDGVESPHATSLRLSSVYRKYAPY